MSAHYVDDPEDRQNDLNEVPPDTSIPPEVPWKRVELGVQAKTEKQNVDEEKAEDRDLKTRHFLIPLK